VQPSTPQAPAGGSSLAGRYECQQMRGSSIGGMFRTTFVTSALGVFEIDGDGGYRSPSYPTKGAGRVQANGAAVAFDGGAYPGSIGVTGTNSTGFYIRLSGVLTEAPAAEAHLDDHVCYRRR